jgi:hypothetical protein
MATIDDVNSTLQNIARQMGGWVGSLSNAFPAQTVSTSPISTPINSLTTTAAVSVIGTSAIRHGLIFHNPGTASVYVFPSLTTAPNYTTAGGAFLIAPGVSLEFPSSLYPNINCAWSAFSGTGSNQALTVVEFF